MGRPKKQKEYSPTIIEIPQTGLPAEKKQKIERLCFYCGEIIVGETKVIGIDRPYISLYLCKHHIEEMRSQSTSEYDGQEKWLQDNAERIYKLAAENSMYTSRQKSKILSKGKK